MLAVFYCFALSQIWQKEIQPSHPLLPLSPPALNAIKITKLYLTHTDFTSLFLLGDGIQFKRETEECWVKNTLVIS